MQSCSPPYPMVAVMLKYKYKRLTANMVLQISTWRLCRTKVTRSTKPWVWGEWDLCNAVCMLAAVPTASPGPPTTGTAAHLKGHHLSDPKAVPGPKTLRFSTLLQTNQQEEKRSAFGYRLKKTLLCQLFYYKMDVRMIMPRFGYDVRRIINFILILKIV